MNEVNLLIKCSICGKKYREKSIKIVQNKKEAMLVHVSCDFCHSSSLAVINKGMHGGENMVTLGILTDLDYQEACEFLRKEPISLDEVLDLYKHPSQR